VLLVIDAILGVLDEYQEHLPLTLRQVFYRLVVKAVIDKTERDYKRLGEILNRARRAELVSFDAMRDDGLIVRGPTSYRTEEHYRRSLDKQIGHLQINRQAGQPRKLQIWCEASGMVPQLARVAAPYGIDVISSGGFDSTTVKHDFAQEVASGESTTVLHLGDFDPSGVHMFSSLEEDVCAFAGAYGGDIGFVRVAVT
jgi:hypothetical protein